MEKRNIKYHIIYGCMIALLLFMIIWASVKNSGTSLTETLSRGHIAFKEGWITENGKTADVSHLNKIPAVEPYQETSIYHVLPDSLDEGLSLCFRSKNIFYKVYVDGELRYSPEIPESFVYNNTLGTRWNYVPLYNSDAGKTVEIRFYTVYNSASACLDHLYLGIAAGEILTTFSEKAVSLITCLLLQFVAVLLIIADIPINMQAQKNHELAYLGLFAACVSLWCLSETNLFQFFTNDSRILQVISCYALILVPIPLMLYLDSAFGFKRNIVLPIICYLSGAEFLLCTILHFTKLWDYHTTLIFSHIMLAASAVILVSTIIRNTSQKDRSRIKNIYKTLRTIGLISIAFCAMIDIIRFYRGNRVDTAMFVRIGLLIFILCYGSSSLEKTIDAVRLGVQSEFVSQLAYRDGLTGIGNRTAFQEHLMELEKVKNSINAIAIIMFDVNDLKYVNDNLGHQQGDAMLVCSANIIRGAWEPESASCYRIGGDEFAVIISGDGVPERCGMGILHFTNAIQEYNSVKNQPFRISIAHGYAVYDETQASRKLMDIYKQADERMYENKKKIKAVQVKPEVFYANRK